MKSDDIKKKSSQLIELVGLAEKSGKRIKGFSRGMKLINILTKGLKRHYVILSKIIVLSVLWTGLYFLCFGITYGYNQYFWGNSEVFHFFTAALFPYFFGIMLILLIIFTSIITKTTSSSLACMGGFVIVLYIVQIIPEFSKYLPLKLLSSYDLLLNNEKITEYAAASVITAALIVFLLIISIFMFNRKNI